MSKKSSPKGKSFGVRAGAFAIDYMVQPFITNIALACAFVPIFIIKDIDRETIEQSNLLLPSIIMGLLMFLFYFAIFEGMFGATVGKLLLGTRVVDLQGEPCGYGAAFIRALYLCVEVLLLGIPAYLSMKAPPHQRLGDKAAHTLVVDKKYVKTKRRMSRFYAALFIYFILSLVVSGIVFGLTLG